MDAYLPVPEVTVTGNGALPSVFDVTGLAVSSMTSAATAIARLARHHGASARENVPAPDITIDRNLASLWFGMSFQPVAWELPPVWDSIAGDYRCADGWIRLHTNAAHHRAAALKTLGLGAAADRATVGSAVDHWSGGRPGKCRAGSQWLCSVHALPGAVAGASTGPGRGCRAAGCLGCPAAD